MDGDAERIREVIQMSMVKREGLTSIELTHCSAYIHDISSTAPN